MVSLRRRRNLGLSSGPGPILDPLFWFPDNGSAHKDPIQDTKPVILPPMPFSDVEEPTGNNVAKVAPGPSNAYGSGSSKEQFDQQIPGLGHEVKRRKRHRRKHFQNQEPCLMRGVYFKNLKWQAAIKVDKKQIHLGTVATQEEAAHLYDRAAFMCGREPNFELSEEEKRELSRYKWEEFLAITRSSITNKKHRRRLGAGARKKSEPPQSSDMEVEQATNSLSASEDVEPEASAS